MDQVTSLMSENVTPDGSLEVTYKNKFIKYLVLSIFFIILIFILVGMNRSALAVAAAASGTTIAIITLMAIVWIISKKLCSLFNIKNKIIVPVVCLITGFFVGYSSECGKTMTKWYDYYNKSYIIAYGKEIPDNEWDRFRIQNNLNNIASKYGISQGASEAISVLFGYYIMFTPAINNTLALTASPLIAFPLQLMITYSSCILIETNKKQNYIKYNNELGYNDNNSYLFVLKGVTVTTIAKTTIVFLFLYIILALNNLFYTIKYKFHNNKK